MNMTASAAAVPVTGRRFLATLAAFAAGLGVALACIPVASSAGPTRTVAQTVAPSAPRPAALAGGDRARLRCATCGRVTAIRHIEATPAKAESYEFTVRLYHSAVRTDTSASAGSWRIGDQVILIGDATVL